MSRLNSRGSKLKSSDVHCKVSDQSDDRRVRIRLTPFPGRAWSVSTVSRVRFVMWCRQGAGRHLSMAHIVRRCP
jgi:hypothetical protein